VLAVIDKGGQAATHGTPVLFVHGGYHAAWCWDEHFLDFFAARGYRALAPSLRGHGDSPLTGPLNECSIAAYVRDIASVADGLPTPPGRDMLAVVGSPGLTRQAFFTPSTPESLIAQYSARLERESHRALTADMMYRDLPQPGRVTTPLLVLGGEADWMLRPKQVRATTHAYGTAAELFPMGHNMMLEPG